MTHLLCHHALRVPRRSTLLWWQILMDVCAKFCWLMRYDVAPMLDDADDAPGARRKLRNSASGDASRDLGNPHQMRRTFK
jgi:hypothetical protein